MPIKSLLLFVVLFFVGIFQNVAQAEYQAPEGIFQRAGLENRINFWKEMFTRYGEDDLVFHYRDYPWIIYSVVNVKYLRDQNVGTYAKERDRVAEQEKKRIQNALYALSYGKAPDSELEHHIAQLFMGLPGGRNKYLLALAEDQLRYQSGVKELFRKGVIASGRYLEQIEKVFQYEGVPVEISRLPLVESSFNYNAYSSVGAAGIWQFMPGTAKKYMIVGRALDERRDPLASSRAAAKYLKHAYHVLGSWPLAITSYNHGVSGVARAVKDVGSTDMRRIIKSYLGSGFGFASQNFYCEFIAALEVEKNYHSYFPDLDKEDAVHVQEVRLERSHNINELVKRYGVDRNTLVRYNPAFLAPIAQGRHNVPTGYLLKLPAGRGMTPFRSEPASEVSENFDELRTIGSQAKPDPVRAGDNVRSYTVAKGDTVSRIARKFGVSRRELMAVNGLANPRALRVGRSIKIPTSEVVSREEKSKKQPALVGQGQDTKEDQYYTVKSGDSVYSIAKANRVGVKELQQLNKIERNLIKPGQKLRLK